VAYFILYTRRLRDRVKLLKDNPCVSSQTENFPSTQQEW